MRKLFFILTVIAASIASIATQAQSTMDVARFTRLDNDMMARITKPVRDNDEGKLCALIRVVTDLKNIEFRADALGIVKKEQHQGEVWIYVPYGARSLSLSHEGFYTLVYQYEAPIDEGTVYELRLKTYSAQETANAGTTNTQMVVLSHNPDNASVFIDGVEVKSEHGVFAAMMSRGKHSYTVSADYYDTAEGEFELGGEIVRINAPLKAQFGEFELFTLPVEGFNVMIDGKLAGTSPYKSGRIAPGKYRVHLEKKDYYPADTVINVRRGELTRYTCSLTSHADSLFYNRQLGGRKVSFGITAGYLIPQISASAGSEWCGSMMNYAMADSHENADYKSASGFTAGVFADIRLVKNLYLMAGLNFAQYKWKNEHIGTLSNYSPRESNLPGHILVGDNTHSFTEDYTHSTIEIPIMASYRFVLSKTGSLHINAGPYLSYGISAKMKFAGVSNTIGKEYPIIGNNIDYSRPSGDFNYAQSYNSTFNLYSSSMDLDLKHTVGGSDFDMSSNYTFAASPLKRMNFGIKAGVAYEIKGIQLGITYNLMLSNMANDKYWSSQRIPVFNGKEGDNVMSDYKQRISSIEVKIGYVLRY